MRIGGARPHDRRTALLLGRLLHEDGYDTEVEPDGAAALARFAHEPTPDAAAAVMRKTGEVWAPVIKRLNIKLD